MTSRFARRTRPPRARAFTLVELLAVMVIIGIMAGIAVPRLVTSISLQRLEGAARRITTDLAYAQRQARFTSSSKTVKFNTATESYTLAGIPDPDHPAVDYAVSLGEEPYGANIVSASFGALPTLTFDGFGRPDNGGTVVIAVGKMKKTLTLDAATRVTLDISKLITIQ